MATLAFAAPASSVNFTVAGSSWQQAGAVTVDTTGDVTSITVRLTAESSIGTGNVNFRLVRSSIVISTGSKDITSIPDLPTGFPDGIEYVIAMSSVRITVADSLVIEVQKETLSGFVIVQWHGQITPSLQLHIVVTGAELPAPTKANTPAPTNANTSVTLDQATITWDDGGGADTFNVYYGTDSGSLTLVSSAQAGTSFTVTGITDGAPYSYLSTRYWRIDSTNNAGTTTGDEWSFITIRFTPIGVTYFYPTTGQYYRLLIQSDGSYGDVPGVGVENTDYVFLAAGYEANFVSTARKLVSAANSKIWIEDI